jgi:hypothetical protein
MSSFSQNVDESGYGNMAGGYGGGGLWFIVIALVFWFLFDGRGRNGYGDGYGIAPASRPYFPDESNYEEERNLRADYCNKTEKILDSEASTRALIEANYIQDLRDKLAEKSAEVMTLKQNIYTDGKFEAVYARLAEINCKMLDKPPLWADCSTPTAKQVDNYCDYPRRGRLDFAEAY